MSNTQAPINNLYDVPGPKGQILNVVISALCVVGLAAGGWFVMSALADKGQLAPEKWRPFLTPEMWQTYLLPGIVGTLQAAVFAIILAIILGILLGIGRLSDNRLVRYACAAVVEFFRAIPLLILMIFCFQLFADYDLFPSTDLAVAAVITGLALSNGAVIAEIVRAGIKAIPRGQGEAAVALGLGSGQTLRMILLPQAITAMLPAIVAQLVVALKDTALGYQITYVEAVRQGIQAGSAYSNYIPALVVIALVMIVINLGLSRLATYIELRLRSGRKAPAESKVGDVLVPQA